jgi:hypothetical protein
MRVRPQGKKGNGVRRRIQIKVALILGRGAPDFRGLKLKIYGQNRFPCHPIG